MQNAFLATGKAFMRHRIPHLPRAKTSHEKSLFLQHQQPPEIRKNAPTPLKARI